MEEFARKLMSEQTSLFLQSFTDTVSVSEDVLEGREDRGEEVVARAISWKETAIVHPCND